ncbi:hypothetical protein ACHAXT_003767 [Thalassiosira profunda]
MPRKKGLVVQIVLLALIVTLPTLFNALITVKLDDLTSPISLALGDFRATPSSRMRRFTVDILSVSSITNPDLLAAQRDAFAAHPSVRHIFNATEHDDADPDCHTQLSWSEMERVVKFCRPKRRELMLQANYARMEWLRKKANPIGWLCAQVRPLSGLRKVYKHYIETREVLPDFLLVMDDDTWYDMEHFVTNFGGWNTSEASYHAGCLIRFSIGTNQANFSAPFGGYGSIMSRGTLENLFRPMNCPSFGPAIGEYESQYSLREICNRLDEDRVKERRYFRNGMNLVELMYEYSSTEKYRDVASWTTGYCMHSDWVLGYFANFYYASEHVAPATEEEKKWMDIVPHLRIQAYRGSEIYRKATGICKIECKAGHEGTEICHRATAEWFKMKLNAKSAAPQEQPLQTDTLVHRQIPK